MLKQQHAIKALGTRSSIVVEDCQICGNQDLDPLLFIGFLPPVNTMHPIGTKPFEESSYPAQLLYCRKCHLVQLGLIVDAQILFPPNYPYTSGTTKILRDNFAELYEEAKALLKLNKDDLVVDIGCNDGTLLSNFAKSHRVQGVTPEQMGKLAIEKGIPTIISFFDSKTVDKILADQGHAHLITATNVFAHMENINDVLKEITRLLDQEGCFISESHYLIPLLETLQYDTIYHEHLRYYSLHSLKYLLEKNGLEVFHAKKIPTHGGSIRVYSARKGQKRIEKSVYEILKTEEKYLGSREKFAPFRQGVLDSKLALYSLLWDIKKSRKRVFGIGAPSRASTLIHYVGLDDGILDCVCEIKGSHKVGKYMPGTLIPVYEESKLFEEQPEYALLLSWHIADEISASLKKKGFKGKFIVPLPTPRVI